jgi:hypothetical protein
MRLSDLSDVRAGRRPVLATGDVPAVARALTVEEGDLIIGAQGAATDSRPARWWVRTSRSTSIW